jgi:hypothetical protein
MKFLIFAFLPILLSLALENNTDIEVDSLQIQDEDILPIRCDQLHNDDACQEAPHCQILKFRICKRKRCRTLSYGCKARTFCKVSGPKSLRQKLCKRLPACQWRGRNCVLKDALEPVEEAGLYHKSNLCFSWAFNGKCDELRYNFDKRNYGFHPCYCRSDFSDCYALYGEEYVNATKYCIWGK